MSKNLSANTLLSDFQSGQISEEELEHIIKELVRSDSPDNDIANIEYNKDGVTVTLDDGQVIEIEIDWEEIILI